MSKPKAIKFELIPEGAAPYQLLEKVRDEYHEETAEAKIALAWKIDTKPDVDGHLVLGKCIRVNDLYKEFAIYDFIITLNRETWEDREFGDARRIALLDHELCHAARKVDNEGDPMIDDRERPVWRSRKHDIEEFQSVVEHHGCYKRDLQQFAEALKAKRNAPLFASGSVPPAKKPSENRAPLQ